VILLPGLVWCRGSTPPAEKRASAGSQRRATGKSADCWFSGPQPAGQLQAAAGLFVSAGRGHPPQRHGEGFVSHAQGEAAGLSTRVNSRSFVLAPYARHPERSRADLRPGPDRLLLRAVGGAVSRGDRQSHSLRGPFGATCAGVSGQARLTPEQGDAAVSSVTVSLIVAYIEE
jgi:hypothetical protein